MKIIGKLIYPLHVEKSRIHGKGVFAVACIPARKKIGSLAGQVITKKAGREKARSRSSIALVELWNGKTLDASINSNALRFINHSCHPNTFMRNIGFHVEFYALNAIGPGEELTCNYGSTHHDGYLKCTCGSKECKGFI
jgi:uncharacterized protein